MIQLESTAPVFRIFSVEKAREFYIDYLGFNVDFVHRFGEDFPLYMGLSRNGIQLHLSEHHGDSTPGSTVYIRIIGIEELYAELQQKNYPYLKPGLETMEWGTRELWLTDPFGNKLRFSERLKD
jgi:uncharacterized glyoxalase superfamily protein PhnB